MAKEAIKALKAKIAPAIVKGATAEGEIVELTQGLASDYMTEEQMQNRLCGAEEPYLGVIISVNGAKVTSSFKDYTRIGDGQVSPNTDLGKLGTVCDMAVGAKVPMYAAAIQKAGKEFIIWRITGL